MDKQSLQQYWSALEGAGFHECAGRRKLRVSGPDRVTFLHNMISNDVEGLQEFTGKYATFLTSTGKIIADFYYYRFPEWILIDIEKDLLGRFQTELEKFIIMDDVELTEVRPAPAHFSIQGPEAGVLVAEMCGIEPPRSAGRIIAVGEKDSFWVMNRPSVSAVGFEVILPPSQREAFWKKLKDLEEKGSIAEMGGEALEVLRVEAGIPRFGVDMTERNNPLEAGLHEAISLQKGCYTGQEVLARATYIGGVARRIARVRIEDHNVPDPNASVLNPEGQKVGKITSAVFSPRLDTAIALALLKRSWTKPGVELRIESAGGPKKGEVVERFLE